MDKLQKEITEMKKTKRFAKLLPAVVLICMFGLGLLFPVKAYAYVRISSSTFPDENFMNYVKKIRHEWGRKPLRS